MTARVLKILKGFFFTLSEETFSLFTPCESSAGQVALLTVPPFSLKTRFSFHVWPLAVLTPALCWGKAALKSHHRCKSTFLLKAGLVPEGRPAALRWRTHYIRGLVNFKDVVENNHLVMAINNAPLYFNVIGKGSLISGSYTRIWHNKTLFTSTVSF